MAGTGLFDLSGEVVLVTGASRGIGAALAKGLAAAGAEIVLAARSEAALADVAAQIRAAGGKAHAYPLDVATSASVDALFARLAEDGIAPSILVNNAGTEEVAPALEVTDALWDKIVGTNLKGAFNVARAFARARGGVPGAIVNLCSLASEVGIPTAVPYTASKSGLAGMTRAPKPKPQTPCGEFPKSGRAAKAGLNREMLQMGLGTMANQLSYKLNRQGKALIFVPAHYTSQECSRCTHTSAENRISQAEFYCQACGFTANADYNAALAQRRRAWHLLQSGPVGSTETLNAREGTIPFEKPTA